MKKTVKDIEVSGKRVLVRVDFNVPIENGHISDDRRIRASLPTIRYLVEQHARVILLSHLGRKSGFVIESLRMNPVAEHLSELLGQPVAKVNNCIGPEVQEAVKMLEPGQVLMLENARFHPGEMVNDAHFAEKLASIADIYVDDAFATLHRNHASIVGVARHLPSVAGLLVEKELQGLRQIRNEIRRPVMVILGGERLVDKIHFIDDQLERGNRIMVGGVLANIFLKAKGREVGQSAVEAQALGPAHEILVESAAKIQLPVDLVVAESMAPNAKRRVVSVNRVPPTWCILDIGPETIQRFNQNLDQAGTIIWNGPMGAVETPGFSAGTDAIARKMASLENVVTIAGGGDTLRALDRLGLSDKMDYVSTGGAAFLIALENKPLPGIQVLQDCPESKDNKQSGEPSARQESERQPSAEHPDIEKQPDQDQPKPVQRDPSEEGETRSKDANKRFNRPIQ